ncbi:cyclophilin-like protein [Xylona heveae TC161]|uniref:Cyclophilin-like protein n=1 Tax=Xylona heveae (strain CBS 132557 / TC161) TaxID=1328760 RepID=A0A165AII0_XYLHT|nr:cyclophilin-like protein [Xylona heveae TC161]KZF20537.1 cyclophilin-like protein [Xylona heveae TC161]
MSSLYNLEPQPTGKVLLQTTSGDLEFELFAKQTPLTCRNFLQLCLDGYYDGTIFHRLVPGFVIQGGDPTGTGEGGEAIYDGGLFADEFHTRLKFNRRGLLGMANTGRRNDNGSQFFLTLDKTEELTGRNTMFGRIVGDTIYNLMKMAEAELVEGTERPQYPTKVTGTEILINPFEDMVRREIKPKPLPEGPKEQKAKPKKKKPAKTLLSFGEDEMETDTPAPATKKAKFNPKLVSAEESHSILPSSNGHPKPAPKPAPSAPAASQRPSSPPRRELSNKPVALPVQRPARKASRSPSSSPEPALEPVGKVNNLLERTNAQIAELKASMKRNVHSSESEHVHKKSALEQMIPEGSIRGRKRKQGGRGGGAADERRALDFLNSFRAKLEKAPAAASAPNPTGPMDLDQLNEPVPAPAPAPDTANPGPKVGDAEDEAELCDLHFIANCQSCKSWDTNQAEAQEDNDNDRGWMSHALSFEKDRLGKDLMWKKKNEEELVVIDPREKGKEIKESRRSDRDRDLRGQGRKAYERDRPRDRDARR